MSHANPSLPHTFCQRRLVTCVAAIVSITTPAIALSAPVTNCNDSGPNSLRAAVASAMSGDTIDLTSLPCSTITLEDFQIVTPLANLTIKGPATGVTIAHDGNYDRLLNHQGSGTLKLENIRVTGGDPYSASHDVNGGCIYSKGNVYLKNSSVTNCLADANGRMASGGGLYILGDLKLVNSTIADNRAGSSTQIVGEAGGAHVGGNLEMYYSSVRNNSASTHNGGISIYGNFHIAHSTISGNSAAYGVGGLYGGGPLASGLIDSSTVSGNHANFIGGVQVFASTTIRNSTIAFNSAVIGKVQSGNQQLYQSPGLATDTYNSAIAIDLESSILANNTYSSNGATIENDFSDALGVTVSGKHNLIFASFATFPPNVAIMASCPLLGPLRNNGGVTQTHALLSHSPAIDAGSNPNLEQFDQRGSPYKRSDGLFVNFTDIGAYEVQQEDVIFNAAFDGCP